jgi:hypothetical protein
MLVFALLAHSLRSLDYRPLFFKKKQVVHTKNSLCSFLRFSACFLKKKKQVLHTKNSLREFPQRTKPSGVNATKGSAALAKILDFFADGTSVKYESLLNRGA